MKFPVLWSGLVSRVGASHRVNLMHLSPLDRNAHEKFLRLYMTMTMTMTMTTNTILLDIYIFNNCTLRKIRILTDEDTFDTPQADLTPVL